jgi:DNA-binding transcriptional ArsR family regulator
MKTHKPKRPARANKSVGVAAQLESKIDQAAALLKAMANPQRLRVLCLLSEHELSVGEINAQVDLSQSALSQHLAVLRALQLVCTRRESQTVYYAVAAGPVSQLIGTLHDIYCGAK